MALSIRRQLNYHLLAFALVLGSVFAGVTLLVYHRVEDALIARRLESRLGAAQEALGLEPKGWEQVDFAGPLEAAPEPFAERLRGARPGFHEWEEAGREAHALVVAEPAGGGKRVAILSFDEAGVAERRLALALASGVALTSLLALVLARLLARRIVSPIEGLTENLAKGRRWPGGVALPVGNADAMAGAVEEVATLARALDEAERELAAAAERERRFLREASHELRTPITVVQGVHDLLRDSIGPEDSVSRLRLERLGRGLRRMSTSVNSLLAMARAEHASSLGEAPALSVQIGDLVEEARTLAGPEVEVRHLVGDSAISLLEASMLAVALGNLLRNAVQHTRKGLVELKVEGWMAEVLDTGPGVSAAICEQVRAGGVQPDIGIGLATVQRICARFGWAFTLEAVAGGGTKAAIRLRP